MYIKSFNVNEDLVTLNDWLTYNNHDKMTNKSLPEHGFAVWVNDLMVATAFLRRVEGGYAQLDGLATNPFATSELRSEAIDLAVLAVFETAKELGYKSVYSLTKEPSIVSRSKKFGFKESEHQLIVAPLL